jgi:tetratricopeptide (TPR) repeat protein
LLGDKEQSLGVLEADVARRRAEGTLTSTVEGRELLDMLGKELLETGNGLRAAEVYRESLTARRLLGSRDMALADCLLGLGKALKYDPAHEREEATALLKEALELQKTLSAECSRLTYPVFIAALGCSYNLSDEAQATEALLILREAKRAQCKIDEIQPDQAPLDLVASMSATLHHADVLLHLGKALAKLGFLAEALVELTQAMKICQGRGVHIGCHAKRSEAIRPDMYPDILSSLAALFSRER